MKKFIILLCCIFNFCCKENTIDYQRVHQVLVKDSSFLEFKGYVILPREGDYYWIMLYKPDISFFVTYLGDNKVDRHDKGRLIGYLSSYYPKQADVRAELIYQHIGNMIGLMKQEAIQSVSYSSYHSDSDSSYFIDFVLPSHQTLRYYSVTKKENKTAPKYAKSSVWIDSSWVYFTEE